MGTSGSQTELHPAEAAERQRANILKVVRAAFFILMVTFTMLAVLRGQGAAARYEGVSDRWYIMIVIAVVLFLTALAVDLLVPTKKIATITGILIGILAGMIATLALGWVLDLVLESWVPESEALKALKPAVSSLKVILGITLCYIGVSTVLQTQDDFRLVIPYVEFAKQVRGVRPVIVDTSALIDGRLVDIAATGFIQSALVIPRSVIAELQLLADNSESMTRAKGRRGLEVIAKLQRSPKMDVTIDETPVSSKATDQALVELARGMSGVIMTLDVGLARVAAIQSIPVLNLNDLANAMKSSLLPGEQFTIKLIRPGEQQGQAVGYLPDGTMVVSEDGGPRIGESVALVVTSSLQTSAGRLIFARLAQPGPAAIAPPPPADHAEAPTADVLPPESLADAPTRVPRSPFPPKPPSSVRAGTPRNPRR